MVERNKKKTTKQRRIESSVLTLTPYAVRTTIHNIFSFFLSSFSFYLFICSTIFNKMYVVFWIFMLLWYFLARRVRTYSFTHETHSGQ